jgi:hypothetical protein
LVPCAVGVFLSFEAILKMDLRASLGFLTNIGRSAAPYLL